MSVTLPTIVNWIKAGRLDCHRTAGGHRRIARADLIAFARRNDIPLPPEVLDPEPGRRKRILVIDDEQDFPSIVREYLGAALDVDVQVADNAFEAGLAIGRFRPDLVLVSLNMPDLDAIGMRERLAQTEGLTSVPVVASTRDVEGPRRRDEIRARFDDLFEKPVELETLATRIRERLGLSSKTLPRTNG